MRFAKAKARIMKKNITLKLRNLKVPIYLKSNKEFCKISTFKIMLGGKIQIMIKIFKPIIVIDKQIECKIGGVYLKNDFLSKLNTSPSLDIEVLSIILRYFI